MEYYEKLMFLKILILIRQVHLTGMKTRLISICRNFTRFTISEKDHNGWSQSAGIF